MVGVKSYFFFITIVILTSIFFYFIFLLSVTSEKQFCWRIPELAFIEHEKKNIFLGISYQKAFFFLFFLNIKMDIKKSDLTIGIRILLPLVRSLGSNLKLKKVVGDMGPSNWARKLGSETPTSTSNKRKVVLLVEKVLLLLFLGSLKREKGYVRSLRMILLIP